MRIKLMAAVLLVGLGSMPALASASDFGVDLHGGLLGFGTELSYTLNDYFVVRGQFNKYDYSRSTSEQQINYSFDLNLKTYGALVDWHPMAGTFRVTAGYFSNKNAINALASPSNGTYTINGNTYTSAQVGTLSAGIGFNSSAPYLGIGWTTVGTRDTGLGFEFDLGGLMQGSPTTSLVASGGSFDSNPQLQSDIKAENAKFQSDVDNFKIWPVISLGLVYRF